MSHRYANWLKRLTALALLGSVTLTTGACVSYSVEQRHARRPDSSARPSRSARADTLVSVRDAARQWDLDVVRVSESSALVRNGNNLVMLRRLPSGNAIVNKTRIVSDDIVGRDGQLYLSRDLVGRIDSLLRDAAPAPKAVPTMPLIASRHLSGVTIMVDAGHGGSDPGAPNRHGPVEKTITLDAAQRVKRLLESWGARVLMTRSSDTYPTLVQRVNSSNRADPDLFVSLHADSAENPSAHGFTVYVARKSSFRSEQAANHVERSLKASGINSRGVRRANFRVIADTDDPAVLVEMGYLTNASEARRLSDPAYRQKLAEAIARGVADTFRSHSGSSGSALANRAR